MPQALIDQLADDGVMVLPLGPHDGAQHIIKLTKSQTGVTRENLIAVRFVPLLPGQAQERKQTCDIFAGLKVASQRSGNS